MLQTNKAIIIMASFSAFSVNASTPASDVSLNSGGNVEIAIDQLAGQISGLSSDVYSAGQTDKRHDLQISIAQDTANDATTKANVAQLNASLAGAAAAGADKTAHTALAAAGNAQITADQNGKNIHANTTSILTNVAGIAENKKSITANTSAIDGKVDKSTFQADRYRQDKATQGAADKANQAYSKGAYAQQLAVDAQTVAAANRAAVARVQSRSKANSDALQAQAGQLQNHEERITSLEGATNAQFGALKNEVEENQKEARSGSAAAVAIASMPQVEQAQTVMFSAGAGTFKSESAVSVGASFHAGNAIVKTGFSTTTNDDFAVGAGVGIGF